MIRITNVRGLRTPEQRATVVYVGRACAGWPGHPLANPFKIGERSPGNHRVTLGRDGVIAYYRQFLESLDEGGRLGPALAALWEATGHGAKPLGCWCCEATAGDGSPVVCHAQTLAELLRVRYTT